MARTQVPVTDAQPTQASFTTSMAGSNNDLTFTALGRGPGGNSIRIRIVQSGLNTALSVVVEGTDVTVNAATDGAGAITSTANQVLAALQARADLSLILNIALATSNDGTGVVDDFAYTNLSGGALGIVQPSLTNGDAVNDHYFTNNDGQVLLECVSTDGAPQTVTFYYAPSLEPGVAIATYAETVAAGGTRVFGPFNPRLFNQNTAKDVYFDPAVSNTLDFRAYRVPRQA